MLVRLIALLHQQQDAFPPSLAVVGQRGQAALNPGFSGVTGGTQGLAIARRIGQMGVRSDRLDMIDLEPLLIAAGNTGPAIAFKNGKAQRLPAPGAGDAFRMAKMIFHPQTIRAARVGAAFLRCPSATANTTAAAASMRPRERALASL